MNSYEAIVNKLDELVAGVPVDIAQIACDAKAAIETLLSEATAIQVKNGLKDKRLEAKEAIIRMHEPTMGILSAQRDEAIHRMKAAESTLSRVEAERDEYKRALHLSIETHSVDQRQIERLTRYYLEQARGAQGEA